MTADSVKISKTVYLGTMTSKVIRIFEITITISTKKSHEWCNSLSVDLLQSKRSLRSGRELQTITDRSVSQTVILIALHSGKSVFRLLKGSDYF